MIMTGEQIKSTSTQYVLQSWSKQKGLNPIPVEKAEGIYFYDYDGNRYTDMSSQLVNLNVGYGNEEIAEAIKAQVDKFCFVSPNLESNRRRNLSWNRGTCQNRKINFYQTFYGYHGIAVHDG